MQTPDGMRLVQDLPMLQVLPLWSFPVCSALCSATASVLTHPIDVVKTRLQVLANRGSSSGGGGGGGADAPREKLTAWRVRCRHRCLPCSLAHNGCSRCFCSPVRAHHHGCFIQVLHTVPPLLPSCPPCAGLPAAVCAGGAARLQPRYGRPRGHHGHRQRRHLDDLRVMQALAGALAAGAAGGAAAAGSAAAAAASGVWLGAAAAAAGRAANAAARGAALASHQCTCWRLAMCSVHSLVLHRAAPADHFLALSTSDRSGNSRDMFTCSKGC